MLVLCACNSDDGQGGGIPAPQGRIEEASIYFEGIEQEANFISVQFNSVPQVLDILADFPDGSAAGLSMAPIPALGAHQSGFTLGFEITTAQLAWYCNEDCTVEILEHDIGSRWISIRISGTLTDLFGQNTAELTEALFSVLY